jgi:hypothetical protein
VGIPITVRCECGETQAAKLGDRVECGCGRTYETSELPQERFSQIRAHQARARLYVQVGFVFVVGLSALAFVMWGKWGPAISAPVLAVIWFKILRRWFTRSFVPSPGELPTLELEASKR